MTVPENIANAGLAGAPATFGLYASILPSFVYAMYGSCNQMAVGAVAITCLTLGDGLIGVFGSLQANPNNPADPATQDQINRAIIQVSLLSGSMLTGLGLFRLGFLTNLMSYSVVSGYLAGAALLIIVSQIKFFLGIRTPHASTIQDIIRGLAGSISGFNWRDLVMGLSFLFTLVACKEIGIKWHKLWWLKAVGTLVCLGVGIGVMNVWKLYEPEDNPLVDPLGAVPKGFPQFTVSWWSPIEHVNAMLTTAVTTMSVMLIETICMTRKLAQEHGTTVEADKELRAIGLCNFAAAAFSTVPTAGSISRAAVVNSAHGRTPLSSFVTACIVLVITLFLTSVFTNMPDNLTGAIMISAVYRVMNPREPLYCWKVSLFDFCLYLITFCCVIFLGVYKGMLIGVIIAVAVHVRRSSHPLTVVLARLPGTSSYRDRLLFPEAVEDEGVLMLRVDSGLFFANVPPVRNWIKREVAEAEARCAARGEVLSFLVLDITATHHVCTDTVQLLKGLIEDLCRQDIRVVLVNQSVAVLRALGSRQLDDMPAVDGGDVTSDPSFRHHFGSLPSALHVRVRQRATAQQQQQQQQQQEGMPHIAAGAAPGAPAPMSVYHGDGELFQDAKAAVQHCASMLHTLGLSRRHLGGDRLLSIPADSLEMVAGQGETAAGSKSSEEAGSGSGSGDDKV